MASTQNMTPILYPYSALNSLILLIFLTPNP
jgi:hypothetical protein